MKIIDFKFILFFLISSLYCFFESCTSDLSKLDKNLNLSSFELPFPKIDLSSESDSEVLFDFSSDFYPTNSSDNLSFFGGFEKQIEYPDLPRRKFSGGWNSNRDNGVSFEKKPSYGWRENGVRVNKRPPIFPNRNEPRKPNFNDKKVGIDNNNNNRVNEVQCDIGDKCQHFSQCASFPDYYLQNKNRNCKQKPEIGGICCSGAFPNEKNAESIGNSFNPYPREVIRTPNISPESIENAAKKGSEYGDILSSIEAKIIENGLIVQRRTPAHGHLLFFQTSISALKVARSNLQFLKATNFVQDNYYLNAREAGIGLQNYKFFDSELEKFCPVSTRCDKYAKYRSLDGSCNNLQSPDIGKSQTPLLRLLPPDYADGVWAPRARRDGSNLPNPRFISKSLNPDVNNPDFRYSHLLMQFGQFIDHDLSHVPIFQLDGSRGIDCCANLNDPENSAHHPACFPISIDRNDYELNGATCMNFVRSMVAPRHDCSFGHADQLNQLTHWLDASQIYGNNDEDGDKLREFEGGLLKIHRDYNGRQLLPLDFEDKGGCAKEEANTAGLHCFLAGDKRVNEQVGLSSMHTIWLREHNRIALKLRTFNPNWNDEILYQESRRIVTAQYEHIIYNEWLPIILGRHYMEVFGILPLRVGYYDGYNPAIEPTISNAFTAAAFRMGHTLVNGVYNLVNNRGSVVQQLLLHTQFNNPHLLRQPGSLDVITKGFLTQPVQRFDPYVTTELRDKLFQSPQNNRGGMDLVSLNIQRGRDHGLPSYNEYRDLCRLGKARNFGDLVPIIPRNKAEHLERVYGSVDEIDLWVGGVHETPLPGALLGPTFICIIGDQFTRLKKSDRFFYDIEQQEHSFTSEQLQTIRLSSMARILCDNSDDIRSIQPLAFHLPNQRFNPLIGCENPTIPFVDLSLWKV